jgi:hypothetical protein
MTQDTFHTIVGVSMLFAWPLAFVITIIVVAFLGWFAFTVLKMTGPVWIVFYVAFRAVLYFSLWAFIFAGIFWLFGWSTPIHWLVDVYYNAPSAIVRWLTK